MEKIISFLQSIFVLLLMLFGADGSTPQTTVTPPPLPENASIQVHFLDVGQADAALIICDGEAMLIDGGNSADSSLIYSYLKQRNIAHLKYIVATHGHEDHVGGLSGALNFATVDTALCSVTDYDSEAFADFKKYLARQNVPITVPSVGDVYTLGSAVFEILSCDGNAENHNNASIVLRLVHGETAFLFAGDAEREVEQAILNRNAELSSTVLKVGHHGSSTSTGYQFLWNVMPRYVVISVGADNDYDHPHNAVTSRLDDADVTVFRTDLQGDIICTGDGKTLTFTTEK